jgi:hypothetical protein
MSKIKKMCEDYLGNRGIYHRSIKKCDIYKNMWFIIFNDYPEDVEISFITYCYECYDEIPSNKMKWNKSFYQSIYQSIKNNEEERKNNEKNI